MSHHRHNDMGEEDADAHIKHQSMGREVVVAVTQGRLHFRTWEQIFYGVRQAEARAGWMKIIGE